MGGAAAASDAWASGDAYEPCSGRWSRLVARDFLAWLGVDAGTFARATEALARWAMFDLGWVAIHPRDSVRAMRRAIAPTGLT